MPLIKLQIRKMCAETINDSLSMKSIKKKILEKLDHRFPESEALKIHRVLDPSMKDVIHRDEAISLLQHAVEHLLHRGLISVQTQQPQSEPESDDPVAKRMKLKEEMLCELRRSTTATTSDMNEVWMEITNYLSSR